MHTAAEHGEPNSLKAPGNSLLHFIRWNSFVGPDDRLNRDVNLGEDVCFHRRLDRAEFLGNRQLEQP